MLEILAAYLFLRCYVALDPTTSLPQRSGPTAEQCLVEFKKDVERVQTSRFVAGTKDRYARLASALPRERLDRLLADVRSRIAAETAKK